MTCEEFRHMTTNKRPLVATRAERSAHGQHWDRCPSCTEFMLELEKKYDGTPQFVIDAIDAQLLPVIAEDILDPEFHR